MIAYDGILLEPEQKELLTRLVEAVRSVPTDKRQPLFFVQHAAGSEVMHPGWQKGATIDAGDLQMLRRVNLVLLRSDNDYLTQIDVTPEGFAYYGELKIRSGQPVERQTSTVKGYLDEASFKTRHLGSYEKWAEAEQLLWGADSRTNLTTIGHKCREATQLFATELIKAHQPPNVEPDMTKVIVRLKAVFALKRPALGERESKFLDALVEYWDALNGLIQRQEHNLTVDWEDARRVVFQTAVVIFEIDRSLK